MQVLSHGGRFAAHIVIRAYQLTLFIDHWGSLPALADLLGLYGRGDRKAWALGRRRDGRCPVSPLQPLGTSGFDPVPDALPSNARWWLPWTYSNHGHEGLGEG